MENLMFFSLYSLCWEKLQRPPRISHEPPLERIVIAKWNQRVECRVYFLAVVAKTSCIYLRTGDGLARKPLLVVTEIRKLTFSDEPTAKDAVEQFSRTAFIKIQ